MTRTLLSSGATWLRALETPMVMVMDETLVWEGALHLLWDLPLGVSLPGQSEVITCCTSLRLQHMEGILGMNTLNTLEEISGLHLHLRLLEPILLTMDETFIMWKLKWKILGILWNTRLGLLSQFRGHLFLLKGCLAVVQVLILGKL